MFHQGLIHELMKLHMDQKTKIGSEGLTAVNEVMLKFLNEIIWRTMNQARQEGLNSVNLDHMEKILPQLVRIKKLNMFKQNSNVYSQMLDFA